MRGRCLFHWVAYFLFSNSGVSYALISSPRYMYLQMDSYAGLVTIRHPSPGRQLASGMCLRWISPSATHRVSVIFFKGFVFTLLYKFM